MPDDEDWLRDPLMGISTGSYKYHKLKSLPKEQQDQWKSFHFATRLKLDGADFFCRQALGAASRPYDLGLPLLAHRQQEWYLEAFFFELIAASDTLLQELNILYAYDLGLNPEGVRWDKIKDKLPKGLVKDMEEAWEKDWFYEVRHIRNTATHHYLVPLSSGKVWWGEPTNYSWHNVSILFNDKEGNLQSKGIGVCSDYLNTMVRYIRSVWEKMAQEFE